MSKAEKTFPVNSIHRLRPLSLYFGRIMFLALRMGNKMNIPISSLLSTPSHADIVLEFLCWRIKLCCLAKGETENNKSIPFYYCYYITHVFLKKFLLWISLLGRVVGGMGSRVFSKWNSEILEIPPERILVKVSLTMKANFQAGGGWSRLAGPITEAQGCEGSSAHYSNPFWEHSPGLALVWCSQVWRILQTWLCPWPGSSSAGLIGRLPPLLRWFAGSPVRAKHPPADHRSRWWDMGSDQPGSGWTSTSWLA